MSSLREPVNGPVAVLCEGAADAAFLAALRSRRQLGAFDLPFPPHEPPPAGARALHGVNGFGNMLAEIARLARLDVTLWQRLRGIVIVADAADDSTATLRNIAAQSRRAGFANITECGQWSASPSPLPPVAVLHIPHAGAGGLETLCLEYLRARHSDVAACLDTYWACVPALTPPRTAEKRDKAALACFLAAIERDNPTMTLARVFSGSSPLIDLADTIFTPFADGLASLLATLP